MLAKLPSLLEKLREGLVDRESECAMALLCVLSGVPLYLCGRPGTGKSILARRLLSIVGGSEAAENGSVGALLIDNIDWKDPSTYKPIQVFLDSGNARALVAAGCVAPEDSHGALPALDALAARIPLRVIEDASSLSRLFSQPPANAESRSVLAETSLSEWATWLETVRAVELSDEATNAMVAFAGAFRAYNETLEAESLGWPIRISPRRWAALSLLVRGHAATEGRTKATIHDFLVLGGGIWGHGIEAEIAKKGFQEALVNYLSGRGGIDLSVWEKRIPDLAHEVTRALCASHHLFRTVKLGETACVEFKVVIGYEHLVLYAPAEYIGSNDEFAPLKENGKEETRIRCNFNGGTSGRIQVEANSRQKGYRMSSTAPTFEDYGSFNAEVVLRDHPETKARNQQRLDSLRKELQTALEIYTAVLVDLKALAQDQKALLNSPFLPPETIAQYRECLQNLFERRRSEAQEVKQCWGLLNRDPASAKDL